MGASAGYFVVRFRDAATALGRYHVGDERREVPASFASTFDTQAEAIAALAAYAGPEALVVTHVTANGRRDVYPVER